MREVKGREAMLDRRFLLRAAAILGCSALVPSAFADASLQSTANQREAVLSIAGPTLDAKLGGDDQSLVKYLTLEAAPNEGVAIGAMGVLKHTGDDIVLPKATIAVVLFRADSRNATPHSSDDRFTRKGVLTFIAAVPDRVWEVGLVNDVVSVRSFTADKLGDWEPFQSDPTKYKLYK